MYMFQCLASAWTILQALVVQHHSVDNKDEMALDARLEEFSEVRQLVFWGPRAHRKQEVGPADLQDLIRGADLRLFFSG